MSDIKLFRLGQQNSSVVELSSQFAKLEKDLQKLVEQYMETFLGVRLLATEFTTTNKGRIDSLGIDENNCPVIIEYKRHSNENVINQGLFYLNWLLDHKADFQLLTMKILSNDIAETIEWSGARLICIASDFNKYDEHAIQLIDRNIELMRYKYFGEDLFLLELVNAHSAKTSPSTPTVTTQQIPNTPAQTTQAAPRNDSHEGRKGNASSELLNLYDTICEYGLGLGDEVQRKELKFYTALKKIKNFASIQVWAPLQDPSLRIYLNLNPDQIDTSDERVSDVRNRGHWGTGDLEVVVRTIDDLELAKSLIELSFQKN